MWVIAETADLPTPYRKIVVTDGRGRFVDPRAARGRLPGVGAWLRAPRLGEGPRHGRAQGGGARRDRDRGRHRPGNGGELPRQLLAVALQAAREHAGPAGRAQPARLDERLQARLRALPPDGLVQRARHARQPGRARRRPQEGRHAWTAPRWASAATPSSTRSPTGAAASPTARCPRRRRAPTGIERNMVITQWGWGDLYTYAHDEIATDKRNPRLYPDGKIWGVDLGNDRLLSVDPVTHEADARQGAHGRRLRHAVGRPGAERLQVARRPRPGRLDPARGRVPEPGEPAQPDDGRHRQGVDDHPDPGRAARGLPRVLPRRPRDRRATTTTGSSATTTPTTASSS